MPTSDSEDQTSLAFYEEIEKVIMKLDGRKDRVIIVMRDFNSMVGETEVDGIVGAFSFGQRNHKGQLLKTTAKRRNLLLGAHNTRQQRREDLHGNIQVEII